MNDCFEISKYAQDRNPTSHIHEDYEILISLTSEGKFFVCEHGYPLQFGLLFVLPPFEIHRCFCRGNQSYERFIIHFPADMLKEMSTDTIDMLDIFGSSTRILEVPGDVLMVMVRLLSELQQETTGAFGEEIKRKLRLEEFLLLAAQLIYSREETPFLMTDDGRVSEILKYIHNKFAEDISLERMSKDLFLSKSRLCQIFKESTGFSVGSYIVMYRIKRACSLLKRGMSVQNAGRQVGFHNDTHFIRTFKQHIGCSPGKFAKSSTEN